MEPSCETCKHLTMGVTTLRGNFSKHEYSHRVCLKVTGQFYYGCEGCAYEPRDNKEEGND